MTTLPQSRRPDGSLRPAVRVKAGYVPPEEQKKFGREEFKPAAADAGVVGADPDAAAPGKPKSKSALKNEKRKQKKQEGGGGGGAGGGGGGGGGGAPSAAAAAAPAAGASASPPPDAGSEVEKKLKNLRKRLRQIEELEAKEKGGTALNDDQKGKVAARAEVEADIAKWEKMASGEADLAKKVKNLRKKLRQIEELEERLGEGLSLNDEQTSKIESKPKVELELQTLEALVGAS